MERLRALFLLAALLASPAGLLAKTAVAASACCCGASQMCPLRYGHQGHKAGTANPLCGSSNKGSCAMTCNSQAPDFGILQVAHAAVLTPHFIAIALQESFSSELFISSDGLQRSVVPPEQPPRHRLA
jgi:hypothetical protein